MDEISLIADEKIEEMGMLSNEKSKLPEELKRTQDLIQEQETELADVTLFVKEHINCSENVKNLMEAKESLTQENHQLHAEMDLLCSAPVGNQGPYMPPCNQAPHTYSYSDFPMHSAAVPTENLMPYGGPNTENGPLNDSVSQMPNQSTQVQSTSVPPTSQVVHNQLKLTGFETDLELSRAMKSLKDSLSRQIMYYTEAVLKETKKSIEVEKEKMSENLLWEIKKVEELQINVEELKANLSTRESEM